MRALDDTIAGIPTAPRSGGLAVVRVSGAQAVAIGDAVFRGSAPLESAAGNTLHHGWAASGRAAEPSAPRKSSERNGSSTHPIDEVVVALFRAPHSYTREDVVEISCHG